MPNPILYIKGQKSTDFYLILSGKVAVTCGSEEFQVEMGAFMHLGAEALIKTEYVPDYSAKVQGSARLLHVMKDDFQAAISLFENMRKRVM